MDCPFTARVIDADTAAQRQWVASEFVDGPTLDVRIDQWGAAAAAAGSKSWTSDSYGFLYTPEVFDELPSAMRQGVRPNAFAALSEILAGFWDKDGFGDDEAALLQMAGIPAGNTSRIGPRYPFLIGQSNGSVTRSRRNTDRSITSTYR